MDYVLAVLEKAQDRQKRRLARNDDQPPAEDERFYWKTMFGRSEAPKASLFSVEISPPDGRELRVDVTVPFERPNE
jgi:hypothetical protein